MATEAKKVSQLTEIHAATANKITLIVNDPAGTPSSRKLSVRNLFSNSTVNVAITSISPSNSTMTAVKAGSIFFDTNYIYVAVANNVVKRAALSSF